MATIIRRRMQRNFTVLPNSALRDPQLSFRATGLLAYLMSLPTGVSTDAQELSKRKREGRDAIRTAFRELETAGYLIRVREQDEKGQWVSYVDVFDAPQGQADSQHERAGNPTAGNLTVGAPGPNREETVTSNKGEGSDSPLRGRTIVGTGPQFDQGIEWTQVPVDEHDDGTVWVDPAW